MPQKINNNEENDENESQNHDTVEIDNREIKDEIHGFGVILL